jgi:hypothetical protein
MMKPLRILAVFSVVAIIALLIFNPAISYLASPRWEVFVADESGQPLQGMTVRLSWAHYSVEDLDHEEDLKTDENVYVVFPAKTSKASLVGRMVGRIESVPGFPHYPHSSFGPHAFVFAFGNGLEGSAVDGKYLTDWTGKPALMQSRIIAKPMGK